MIWHIPRGKRMWYMEQPFPTFSSKKYPGESWEDCSSFLSFCSFRKSGAWLDLKALSEFDFCSPTCSLVHLWRFHYWDEGEKQTISLQVWHFRKRYRNMSYNSWSCFPVRLSRSFSAEKRHFQRRQKSKGHHSVQLSKCSQLICQVGWERRHIKQGLFSVIAENFNK